VSALNSLIADATKEDGLVLHASEKEDPFDDGAGGPMQVKRKEDPRRLLVDTNTKVRLNVVSNFDKIKAVTVGERDDG